MTEDVPENVTDVRRVQPWNALVPIVVTEDGITIDVRLVQSRNALAPIVVTEDGIVYEPDNPPGYWINVVCNLLNKHVPSEL